MSKSAKYTPNQALEKIKLWCDLQERCQSEVRSKLYDWGLYSLEVENIIAELILNNYLSEERFARAYVSGKFRIKGWGWIKIHQNLKQKGISEYCIKKGKEEIDEEEYRETLRNHIAKKRPLTKAKNNYELKNKVARFAFGKGFESDLVWEVISESFDQE